MTDDAFKLFPLLGTENLLLRELTAGDAEALYGILSNDEVTRYYDDDSFTTVGQSKGQIEAWAAGFKRRAVLRWAITLKEGGAMIGTCGYYGFHSLHLRASLGYELHPSYWRKGVMTEALRRIVGFGFEALELRRVQAFVMPANVGSIRLLDRLGFKNEGLLREYETWGSKGFVDLNCLALLKGDWEKSQAK